MKCKNPFAFRPGQVTFWTTVVYLAVVIPLLYVHETVPSTPKDHSLYRGLNLTEAWLDLQTITTNHHPYNSHDNDRVRDYIIDRSKDILGRNKVHYTVESTTEGSVWANEGAIGDWTEVPVTIFDDQVSNFTRADKRSRMGPTGTYFESNNFYIYIRGKEDPAGDWWSSESRYEKLRKTGGVLVNCHFDSVSTGYGATDDGMGCVTLLQLLSYFTSSGRQPDNGIILLFNDAEEDGLLGAYAFSQSPVWEFLHTFVNLEGAGAGGRAILFRATDLEVAEAYAHSPYPFGSVVAADAFKRGLIRSGTDYEVFEDTLGQRGMDIAFYGPRARYHTDQDDARHASVNSIWHMLSAALASTEQLAQTTSTTFQGARPDGDKSKVQSGKPTEGIWFDIFGSALATMALRGLFAWSLTLLVATPLVLVVVSYLLARRDKYYFFARDIKMHSELNDDPVRIGGWKGFFRFPLALIFAGGLTIASILLLAKFNPLIIYSSAYAVWAMTISLFYFALWLIMRGSSIVRPSALQRGFVNIWLFILGWAIQVFSAVAEDRWKLGSLYWAAFLQSVIFLSLLISLLEMFALTGKHDFARHSHDAHQAQDAQGASGNESSRSLLQHDGNDDDDETEEDTPTEATPLRGAEQGYGGNSQPTFANTYRQAAHPEPPATKLPHFPQPFPREQSWSGRLPQWTWIFQFLLLAPLPVILIGNLGLVSTTALRMTGSDGSNLMFPLLTIGIFSILLLLPLGPFIHRVTHHIPIFLLVVFIATFIYNLLAFPFSIENRYKFFFQQIIDVDEGTDKVRLSGLEEYVRPIIHSLPSAAGQNIKCEAGGGKGGLHACDYDASSLPPHLVEGKQIEDLVSVTTLDSNDSSAVTISIDALDTRTCVFNTSKPIYGFSVAGGSTRDERLGSAPEHGFQVVQLWRRAWDGPWNVTLDLEKKTKTINGQATLPIDDANGIDELRVRSDEKFGEAPLEVTVSCKWSDANEPHTIPALTELQQFMPSWAAVTKSQVGLVEVRKRFKIS